MASRTKAPSVDRDAAMTRRIREIVDAMPPLTREKGERIAALMAPAIAKTAA